MANYTIKHIIKRAIQIIAAKFGPHTRMSPSPQLLVLMFHRILPLTDERILFEEPGMIVTPETFKMNLEAIIEFFEIVKLSEWIENKEKGIPLPAKACAITFDDGWADNYEFAYPILHEMNIPATIFLVSDMIGTKSMFWPERLARTIHSITLNQPQQWTNPLLDWIRAAPTDFSYSTKAPSREELSQIIAHAKQFSDKDIHKRLDEIELEIGLPDLPENPSLLNWKQVKKMTESGLIEAGSHTCHHVRLNDQISVDIMTKEILKSKVQIEDQISLPVKTFCFPNGDYSPLALELVKNNYIGAVTTERGWNTSNCENDRLHRMGIHEDVATDKTAFLSRISGWI